MKETTSFCMTYGGYSTKVERGADRYLETSLCDASDDGRMSYISWVYSDSRGIPFAQLKDRGGYVTYRDWWENEIYP